MSIEDKELDEMFHGEPKPLHPDTVYISSGKPSRATSKKETANTTNAEKSAHKPTHDYKDGTWEPVRDRTGLDNLKDCARWVVAFGGLSFLLFYWEQAGLMASSIAVPSMCICTMLAGWGVGKNAKS